MISNNQLKYSQEYLFSPSQKKLLVSSISIFIVMLVLNIFQVSLSAKPILGGNESSHVVLLNGIVTKQTFAIDSKELDSSYYNGRYYSNKPPGYSFLLSLPYYLYVKVSKDSGLVGAFLFAKLCNAIFSSLTVISIFLFLTTFNLSSGSIFFGIAAAIFGTIFPAYSVLATSIPLSILLCTISILFFRFFTISEGNAFFWTISLFSAMYAVIVDYSNGFILFPLLVSLVMKAWKNKQFIAPFLLCCTPLALLLIYNYIVFENPFVLTYSYYKPVSHVNWEGVRKSMSLMDIPHGLYGLLFSPSRGLFLLSPVVLLGVMALWRFFQTRRLDLSLLVLMSFSGIFVISAYSMWHGGHSIGYRHILPSAIILGTLSSFSFESYKRKMKVIAIALLFLSSFNGVMSFFIQLDESLLNLTWKAEPADVHANFYTELLFPYIRKYW